MSAYDDLQRVHSERQPRSRTNKTELRATEGYRGLPRIRQSPDDPGPNQTGFRVQSAQRCTEMHREKPDRVFH